MPKVARQPEKPFRSLLDKLSTDGLPTGGASGLRKLFDDIVNGEPFSGPANGFTMSLDHIANSAEPAVAAEGQRTLLDLICQNKDGFMTERDRLLAQVQSRLFGVLAESAGTPPAAPVFDKGAENEAIERPKTPASEVSVSGYNVAYVKPAPPTAPVAAPTYGASFVSDVTIPDDTEWPAGALFEKRWSVLNSGDTAWPVGTTLVQVGGWKSDSPVEPNVPLAQPGETVEIALHGVQAPTTEGDHMSFWRVALPDGTRVGDRIWIGALASFSLAFRLGARDALCRNTSQSALTSRPAIRVRNDEPASTNSDSTSLSTSSVRVPIPSSEAMQSAGTQGAGSSVGSTSSRASTVPGEEDDFVLLTDEEDHEVRGMLYRPSLTAQTDWEA